MADFTKIYQRVSAALFAEDSSLKQQLAESAPSQMQLNLEPCGRVVDQIARTAFGAAVEAASEDPALTTDKKLRLYLVELCPHLIGEVLGEREHGGRETRCFQITP